MSKKDINETRNSVVGATGSNYNNQTRRVFLYAVSFLEAHNAHVVVRSSHHAI